MAINVNCSNCGKPHKLKDELAGKRIRCTECKQIIVVPQLAIPVNQSVPLPYPPSIPYEREDIGQDANMRILLPVGRSGLAILAGYLGLFSGLVIPAPLAIIFGFLAINDIKKNPQKHGLGRAYFGIIAGILAIVAFLVILANK